VRNWRGLQELIAPVISERTERPFVAWIYGKTGVGKTRFVFDHAKDRGKTIYVKDETDWWNGYTGQDIILFDDFRGQIKFNVMLRLLDWYPYQGQIKGGYVNINSPEMYITSSLKPNRVYTSEKLQTEDSVKQLIRRLDSVKLFKKDDEYEEMKESCLAECMPSACSVTFNNIFV
jgi:hypothetical protein